MVQNGSRVVAAEDGLDLVTVHPIADPDPDAAIPEGLAAAVDLPDIEGGDGVVERHLAKLLPHSRSVSALDSLGRPLAAAPTRTPMQIIHRPANTMLVDR